MRRFANVVVITSGICLATIGLTLLPTRRVVASNVQSVNVTNPSLAVTQSGSWNVGISGTPTVNLGSATSVGINGTANVEIVRDAENAGDAFQAALCIDAGGGSCGAVPIQVHVPLGNILVIDYISGECETGFQAGSAVTDLLIGTNVGGHFLNHRFGNFNIGAGTHFAAGTMTRLYSGPDSNVILGANFVNGDPNDHCDVTISGHLVPQ
jgi:hypothetical protein